MVDAILAWRQRPTGVLQPAQPKEEALFTPTMHGQRLEATPNADPAELDAGRLVLRNEPVPQLRDPATTLTPVQTAFGWSVMLDTVLDRLQLRNAWHTDEVRALPSGMGERLACSLMRRVGALGVRTLAVPSVGLGCLGLGRRGAPRDPPGAGLRREGGPGDARHLPAIRRRRTGAGRDSIYGRWHPTSRG
jgi:hypothetical protein